MIVVFQYFFFFFLQSALWVKVFGVHKMERSPGIITVVVQPASFSYYLQKA